MRLLPQVGEDTHGDHVRRINQVGGGGARVLGSAEVVIIEQWVAQYGVPGQVHSDQSCQLTCDLFRGLLKLPGVTCTTTPGYNPRSNKVKRLHWFLGDIL